MLKLMSKKIFTILRSKFYTSHLHSMYLKETHALYVISTIVSLAGPSKNYYLTLVMLNILCTTLLPSFQPVYLQYSSYKHVFSSS